MADDRSIKSFDPQRPMPPMNPVAAPLSVRRGGSVAWAMRAAANAEPPPHQADALFVETFARGLAVLRSFANRQEPLTIADVARRANVSRSAARRLLHTLVTLGYASTVGQGFTLLPKTLMLASAFLSSDVLAVVGQPIVSKVSASAGMFCVLDVPQGQAVMLVCMGYKLKPPDMDLPDPNPGMVAPMYCSSSGLLFLSQYSEAQLATYLGEVRMHAYTHLTLTDPERLRERLRQVGQAGYAIVDRELSVNLRSISVPVDDRFGRTVAALSLIGPPQFLAAGELEGWLPLLRGAAKELGALL